MEKSIIKIGSSLAVIIPSRVARASGLRKGERVLLEEQEGGIMIRRRNNVTPVDLWGKVAAKGFGLTDQRQLRRRVDKQFSRRWKNI